MLKDACVLKNTKDRNYKIACDGQSFMINNSSLKRILTYDVDGCLLAKERFKRCDRLSLTSNKSHVIYLEFKGTSISTACKQLINTVKHFHTKINATNSWCFIICQTRAIPAARSDIRIAQRTLKRDYSTTLKIAKSCAL